MTVIGYSLLAIACVLLVIGMRADDYEKSKKYLTTALVIDVIAMTVFTMNMIIKAI